VKIESRFFSPLLSPGTSKQASRGRILTAKAPAGKTVAGLW
jgi:hypothetical protein